VSSTRDALSGISFALFRQAGKPRAELTLRHFDLSLRSWAEPLKRPPRIGRLAQLVERFVYTEDVGSSSLSSPTRPSDLEQSLARRCKHNAESRHVLAGTNPTPRVLFVLTLWTRRHVHTDFILHLLVSGHMPGRNSRLPADPESRFSADPEEEIMIRLLIGLALGYVAYRIVRETVSSIPEEFEPIPDPPRKPRPVRSGHPYAGRAPRHRE
jgi:hypothetical protein